MTFSNYLLKDLPKFECGTIRVLKDDFFVPRISEHYLLFKNNYTMPQLKQICKHYKLARSGNKKTLITIIYNFLYYSEAAIKIQKMVKGMLQRNLDKMRGPAVFNRKLCVNDCDFFSLNELISIPISQFYSFKDEDDFIYGFDILSLWQLFGQKKQAENPYNRKPFPEETLGVLRRLVASGKNMNQKINVKLRNETVSREKQLELRIVNVFHFIDTLGNYTNHKWFMELDNVKMYRFCRELHDIWNHRAQLSEETKQRISPNGNPFRNIQMSAEMGIYEIRKNCVLVIENMLYDGITDDDKSLGAYYVLAALTLQSQDAAAALPWLYQSVA